MLSIPRWLSLVGWFLVVAACAPAEAHFLFIRITPPAEGGRAAEVYFSERATAGDPRFVAKIAGTQLWAQATPGEFKPLVVRASADRLRAHLAQGGNLAAVGYLQYGVLARPGQTPFLLRYYPKAIAGRPEELNRLKPRESAGMEIVATVSDDDVVLTALGDGRPVPKAVFHTIDKDLVNEERTADADGRATWTPPTPGNYSLYVERTIRQSGELDGKRYDEIREFATLNFDWPLVPRGPDEEAVGLFEAALAARAAWPGFQGFQAAISGSVDGREFDGQVTVSADGAVKLESDDEATSGWVVEQLGSIVMHRAARVSGERQERPRLYFGDDDAGHPLGRLLIFEGGQFASSYRVRDGQITVVNRLLGDKSMTITALDNETNADGKLLPRGYTVHYWDAESGVLDCTETIRDRWQRVGEFDLPTEHTVVSSSTGGLSVRSFRLREHRLRKAD